jgi:peptidoglycan/LPS O-acetylase OafA/YrhL
LFHADQAVTGEGRIGTTVSPVLAFVTAGHTGVTLFFVLSAFLLSRPFLEQGRGGRRVRLADFFRRRALRIMPLYAAAISMAVVLCIGEPGAVIDGLRALFFVNSITGVGRSLLPYSAVWWSLATEAQFYLVLPALGLCLRSKVGRGAGLVVLGVWAVAYLILIYDQIPMSLGARLQIGLSIVGRTPAFLAGIAAAWLVSRHGPRIRVAAGESQMLRNGGADMLLLVSLLAQGMMLQEVTTLGFFRAELVWRAWHVAESLLWGVILLLVVLAPLRMRPLISNRVLGSFGLLSYSLYLIHQPIIHFGMGFMMERGLALESMLALRIAVIAVVFGVCMAASALTYRWIERPFLMRKARIDR